MTDQSLISRARGKWGRLKHAALTYLHHDEASRDGSGSSPAAMAWRALRYVAATAGVYLTADQMKLARLRNRHRGQRAFILGNGPSLTRCDLSLLKDEVTFGVNSIFYLFPQLDWRPTYYVVEDKLVAEDRAEEIKRLSGMTKVFGTELKYCLGECRDAIWANVIYDYRRYPGFPHFSCDASRCLWVGGTVSYLCMQLAYHMGFGEVYLIGFDHNYEIPADAAVEGTVITSASNDPNHFHPDYFGKGYRWHDPMLERMERGYAAARHAFESDGRKICNATVGGRLETFPRVDYADLFPRPKPARRHPNEDAARQTAVIEADLMAGRRPPAGLDRFSYLILDYTRVRNSRCTYCGIWRMKDGPELGLDAIERTFKGLRPFGLGCCYVTGGEPYATDKVVEIARLLRRHLPGCRISGATNAVQPRRVLERMERVLDLGARLEVHLSINGSEETHDATRGMEGNWRDMVWLWDRLAERRVPVVASMSLMPQTLQDLPFMQRFAAERDTLLLFSWVRQSVRYGTVDEYYSTWPEELRPRLREIEYLPSYFDCPGLSRRLTVTPDGSLYPCEVYHPDILLGNVNERPPEELLTSQRAERIERMIAAKGCHWCQGLGESDGSPKWMLMDCYRRHARQREELAVNMPQAVELPPEESEQVVAGVLGRRSVHPAAGPLGWETGRTPASEGQGVRISAVVCTYRNPRQLALTIESLLNQTLAPGQFEIIVVDNNSRDSTREVVKRYPGVRYVLEPRQGLSFARNTGVEAARGEIVAFTDDDAEASPQWLAALLDLYDRHPDAWAAGGMVLPIWEGRRPWWLTGEMFRDLSLLDWGAEERALEWPERVIGVNSSFRREAFERIGLFDVGLGRKGSEMLGGEETEVQQRVHAMGGRVMYSPLAVVHHRVPLRRMRKGYFFRRAFGAGRTKAVVTRARRGNAALRAETAEVLVSLAKHCGRMVLRPLGHYWRLGGLKGLVAAVGYLYQALKLRLGLAGGHPPKRGRR
jgi:radical SAM protein with 4Fe4S-binding SPASM domain